MKELKDQVTEFNEELAENMSYQQQTDFVQFIKDRVGYNRFRLRKLNSTQNEIVYDDGNKHITYRIAKDPNDDYVKINKVYVGDVGDLTISKYDIKNPTDITGTWNATSMTGKNWFTTDKTTPATLKGEVTGGKIIFQAFGDNRGGRWSFVIDGDTNPVIISTYHEAGNLIISHTLAED